MRESIIVMSDDCDKELNMSLYDYVEYQFRFAAPMLVCHVTEEEYETMLKQIENGCLNERLPRVTNEDLGYNKFRYLMVYDFRDNVISIANYEDFNKTGKYTLNRDGLQFHEDSLQFPVDRRVYATTGIRVYTTETFQDIINHYKK